jgi:hypothetical protein
MAVETRATRLKAIIIVDQLQKILMNKHFLNTLKRFMTTRKDVTRIKTDAEAIITKT